MKVWITKYALSSGIKEIEDATISESSPDMVSWKEGGFQNYAHRNEWHLSLEAAVNEAGRMRIKKIASLKKQIAKLEKMVF